MRQSSVRTLTRSKKKAMLASLDELTERMPSLLDIDHPCAQRQITDARRMVEVKHCTTQFCTSVFASYLFVSCLHWVKDVYDKLCNDVEMCSEW